MFSVAVKQITPGASRWKEHTSVVPQLCSWGVRPGLARSWAQAVIKVLARAAAAT